MLLYLVRHGEALSKTEDPNKPLSPEGENNIKKIAGLLPPNQIILHEVFHSQKLRAEQTAKILASSFAPSVELQSLPDLDPEADIKPILKRLKTTSNNIMLVGHNPFMETLATHLLCAKTNRIALNFSAGSIACFKSENPSEWTLCWALDPHMINY